MVIRAPRRDHIALLSIAFAANFAANLANQEPPLLAATLALVSIIESAVIIYPLAHVFSARTRFDDSYVTARFLLYAGVIGPLCGALLAAGSLRLMSGIDFATTLRHWYVADALGLLTLGAFLLATHAKTDAAPRGTAVTWGVSIFLSSGATLIAFTSDSAPVLFVVAPVLMIATLRAPLVATMVALLSCAAIAVIATAGGVGPLATAGLDPATRVYLLRAFIGTMLFVVLPVRALIGNATGLAA